MAPLLSPLTHWFHKPHKKMLARGLYFGGAVYYYASGYYQTREGACTWSQGLLHTIRLANSAYPLRTQGEHKRGRVAPYA